MAPECLALNGTIIHLPLRIKEHWRGGRKNIKDRKKEEDQSMNALVLFRRENKIIMGGEGGRPSWGSGKSGDRIRC